MTGRAMREDAMTGPLDRLLAERDGGWLAAGHVVTLLVIAFILWASFARFDQVVGVPGTVVPAGQVRIVQHLEGGVITAIDVRQGDRVEPGDRLMTLSLGAGAVNRDEMLVRRDALIAQQARMKAEAEGGEPAFPTDLAERRPAMLAAEAAAFRQRRAEHGAGQAALLAAVETARREAATLAARHDAAVAARAVARRQLASAESLLAGRLIARTEYLERQAELTRAEGEVSTLAAGRDQAAATIAEAEARARAGEESFRRQATDGLSQADTELARIDELLKTASDQQARSSVTAPIAGIVQTLRFNTIGGVVRPGEPILDIVPTEENLMIEGRLPPADIGHVAQGQAVTIKLTAFDYLRYGTLEGEVEQIGANADSDRNGHPYFRVRIRTAADHLQSDGARHPIIPGMEATADIHTGRRSLMSFLVQPVLKLRSEAFRER